MEVDESDVGRAAGKAAPLLGLAALLASLAAAWGLALLAALLLAGAAGRTRHYPPARAPRAT